MISASIVNMNELIAFWLIFTRLVTVMFQLPLFDDASIPTLVKVLTSVFFSYALFPFLKDVMLSDIIYIGNNAFWLLTIINAFLGLIIGFFVKSILQIFIGSGSLITQQIGFGAVRYFDRSSGSQIGPFEKMISLTMLVIILFSGALIPMFKGLYLSFYSLQVSNLAKLNSSFYFFLDMFKGIFTTSLMLASPFVFVNVLINAVLGIISRVVPQMNVIMVSFVVNIGLGLIVFIASSSEFFHTAFQAYTNLLGNWFQYIT